MFNYRPSNELYDVECPSCKYVIRNITLTGEKGNEIEYLLCMNCIFIMSMKSVEVENE